MLSNTSSVFRGIASYRIDGYGDRVIGRPHVVFRSRHTVSRKLIEICYPEMSKTTIGRLRVADCHRQTLMENGLVGNPVRIDDGLLVSARATGCGR